MSVIQSTASRGESIDPDSLEEGCDDCFIEGEIGWIESPAEAVWTRENLPLTVFLSETMPTVQSWCDWFDNEIAYSRADGWDSRVDDMGSMLNDGIKEPIVALLVDGVGYIWGGHHRVSASFKAGRSTILAIVGRLK